MHRKVPVHTSYVASSRQLLRTTILDAVGELLVQRRWAEVTMADVASVVGVSRQTLYNTFGSRQDLAEAYAQREAGKFLDHVAAVVATHVHEPRVALTAAIELFLETAAGHPLVAAISDVGGGELLALLATDRGIVLEAMTSRVSEMISATWPVSKHDADVLGDTLVRLGISHATSPSHTTAHTAEAMVRVLGPFVDELDRAARL
jgi:AcrR family transcriptional regulator